MTLATARPRRSLTNIPGASSLRCYLTALDMSRLVLNAIMSATGTLPPVVTQSGTPTRFIDLRVEVTTLGTLGIAVFRWSEDGGANWTSGVTTAATTVLGTTGITLAWPAGTYATDNVYVGKVAQWNDSSGRGKNFENALAANGIQLPKITFNAINGKPALEFNKAAQTYLRLADSGFATAICGGEDTPCTVFWVGKLLASGSQPFWSINNTTTSTSELTAITATSNWAISKRGETGIELVSKAGTQDTAAYVHEMHHTGTAVSYSLWTGSGETVILSGSAQDANSLTVVETQIGAIRAGANIYADSYMGAYAFYVGDLSAAERGFIRQQLLREWSF